MAAMTLAPAGSSQTNIAPADRRAQPQTRIVGRAGAGLPQPVDAQGKPPNTLDNRPPIPAAVGAGPGRDRAELRRKLANFRRLNPPSQRTMLRQLQQLGPDAEFAIDQLTEFLLVAQGTTDDYLIAGVLDVIRATGPSAARVGDSLSKLLEYRSPMLQGRDKFDTIRLRAYVLATLADIGVPPAAIPHLLDVLVHIDERASPLEVGAAVRAVGDLGEFGNAFTPVLLKPLFTRFAEEEFSLERYEPRFPAEEATTVQLEIMASLGKICDSSENDELLSVLDDITSTAWANRLDPRFIASARNVRQKLQGTLPDEVVRRQTSDNRHGRQK